MESITNESNCGLWVTGLRFDYPNRRICCSCGGEIGIRLTSDARAETYCLSCEKPSPLGSFPVKTASGNVNTEALWQAMLAATPIDRVIEDVVPIGTHRKLSAICERFGYSREQVRAMTGPQVEQLWDAICLEREGLQPGVPSVPAAHAVCPECHGTRIIKLFTSEVPCERCAAKGEIQ